MSKPDISSVVENTEIKLTEPSKNDYTGSKSENSPKKECEICNNKLIYLNLGILSNDFVF